MGQESAEKGAKRHPKGAADSMPHTLLEKTSLVVVNHHGSSDLARLLEVIDGIDEVVVVDHSEDEDEAANLHKLPVHRVVVQSNSGYGAGLNRGVREASGDGIRIRCNRLP